MRTMVHDALVGARELVADVVGDLRDQAELSEDELLGRYEQQHRGDPFAIVEFARQSGAGDALQEGLRYEAEMETLMKKRAEGGV